MISENNPFNIRISNVPWRNKDIPPRNKEFETFPTADDGLHAGFLNTLNAQRFHGCKTIAAIISRLSPPNENNTAAYEYFVCNECGAQADEPYDLSVPSNLALLGKAIIQEENGAMPYTDDQINTAVSGVLHK